MNWVNRFNNWLRPYLTNSWMASPDFTAQMAHIFFTSTLMLASGLLGGSYYVAMAVMIFLTATVKEFWYDMEFELPPQTWGGSLLDFICYQIGMILGLALILFSGEKLL